MCAEEAFRIILLQRHTFAALIFFLGCRQWKNPAGKWDSYARMMQIMQMNPPDDWLMTGWAWNTAIGFSVLYHLFAQKQFILCSALRHKSYLRVSYVTSIRDPFCLWTFINFAHVFIRQPHRKTQGCSLATITWYELQTELDSTHCHYL